MNGEVIQEYLVALGMQIDKPGFNELNTTLNSAGRTIEAATGSWARNFTRATTIIATSIAGVTTAVTGLMKAAASQDLAMEKMARRMMVSKDAAWQMKKATDALGESISDIVITPELMERYQKLVADGANMKPGGDFAATMRGFRDLMFEFTRLKQEVSYAMTWVGYYLLKYLNRPLAEAQARFKSFNDSFVRNMASWTEKLARSLVYIINIGLHFFDLIRSIIMSCYELWGSFPKGVKIATAALLGFFAVLKMSPLGRMITLVSGLFLLIDDYFGHFEGKQAMFGKYWDKLHSFIDTAKKKIIDFANAAEPILEKFVGYVFDAGSMLADFAGHIGDVVSSIRNSYEFKDFCDTMERLGKALYKLGAGLIDAVSSAISTLFDTMRKNGAGKQFASLMHHVWDIFLGLIKAISYCIEVVAGWLEEMAKSETVRDFVDAVSELVSVVLELINAILDLVKTALSAFFDEMDTTEPVYGFRDAVRAVVKIITVMIRIVSSVIKVVAKLLKMMSSSRVFVEFWHKVGGAVQTFGRIIEDVITKALKKVGKFGRALLCLVKGDFKGAVAILGGGGGSSSGGVGNAGKDAADMASYLITNGIPSIAALGIMGNIGGESGYDPAAYNPDDNGSPSGGLAQWHLERFDNLKAFAEERGTDWTDRKTQLDFLLYELQTDYADVLERMKNAGSIEEATEIFLRGFEKPENPDSVLGERIANARAVSEEVMRRTNEVIAKRQSPYSIVPSVYTPASANPDSFDLLPPPSKPSYGLIGGGGMNFMSTARRMRRGVNNLVSAMDPVMLKGMASGQTAALAGAGSTVNHVEYNVNVGGVTVSQTNANPAEIGAAVADKTMERLNAQGQYIMQNRALTGGPNVV